MLSASGTGRGPCMQAYACLCIKSVHRKTIVSGESGLLLVLNCGSSSIKYALYEARQDGIERRAAWSGKVEEIGGVSPRHQVSGGAAQPVDLDAARPYSAALDLIRSQVRERLGGRALAAVVHRVVHGGTKYFQPVCIDTPVLDDLRSYIPLAPL